MRSGLAALQNVVPGSEQEKIIFTELQNSLKYQYKTAFPDKLAPKTVVIVPSLTLDQEILQKIQGGIHYEERMLCLLMLLKMPRTHLVYITSVSLDPVIVDYYLHLLPGITGYHARKRLTLYSCHDASNISLTQKILDRPKLIERIRNQLPPHHFNHMTCFNVTEKERTLAVKLGLPIFGCDPDLYYLGNKSNGRILFKDSGLLVPPGVEHLRNESDVADAIVTLKAENPNLTRIVVKMNDGFSGDGNAVFHFPDEHADMVWHKDFVLEKLPEYLHIVADDLDYYKFMDKFETMGGIAEAFIEGEEKLSPSVQCRINPDGVCEVLSTHEQLLGGEDNQVFLGAYFPAPGYVGIPISYGITELCFKLRDQGVIGRFSVDYISVKNEEGEWKNYAIEINLRKGGTTHPYQMLRFLTEGDFNAPGGKYYIGNGQERYYFSTDNLVDERFRGLTPHDLIEIAMDNELMFDRTTQEGVMFHIIGAMSQYGKLGVVCIGKTRKDARHFYDRTKEVLYKDCGYFT